jgi:hypothetical protein
MFVAFHTHAYFSLGGEVLLYFIVWVEVIEIVNLIWIQIGLEFRKDLKNKKPFSISYWPWDETLPTSQAEPALASLVCSLGAAQDRVIPYPTPDGRLSRKCHHQPKSQWKPVRIESPSNWNAWR